MSKENRIYEPRERTDGYAVAQRLVHKVAIHLFLPFVPFAHTHTHDFIQFEFTSLEKLTSGISGNLRNFEEVRGLKSGGEVLLGLLRGSRSSRISN